MTSLAYVVLYNNESQKGVVGLWNMNWFQGKLVEMSKNKHLIKVNIKFQVHLKYVLALPWEIESGCCVFIYFYKEIKKK